jgi:predicted NBD/HSP70 family sugar kinase
MTRVRVSMFCFAKPKLSNQTVCPEMLGLSADKNMIHAAILSDGGEVVSDKQTSTPADSYGDCLLAVSYAVTALETKAPSNRPTGIALPGVMLHDNMQNAPLGWWNGKAIKQDLQASLGREVVIGARCLFHPL